MEKLMSHEGVKMPGVEPALRLVPMPADLNASGDVFGGWVMSQVDIAGAIPAWRYARGRIATVAVNSFQFKQPISVGDLVSFYAQVVKVGKSSITVDVQVYAERNPANPIVVKVTEAQLTYVALNADGSKRILPQPSA
jgi:acyl-CoA thioesterase YciA